MFFFSILKKKRVEDRKEEQEKVIRVGHSIRTGGKHKRV
jgi:hypothetical protein